MNILKNYTKLSRASYRPIHTFSTTPKYPFVSSKTTHNDSQSFKNEPLETREDQPKAQDPQHFISTDPNFSNFNPAQPVSGSNSSTMRSSDPFNDNLTSSAKQFSDATADTIKGFTDTAAGSTRNLVNNTTTSPAARDLANSATSAAQELMYAATDAANSTAKGIADTASSLVSDFIPSNQTYRSGSYTSRDNYTQRDDPSFTNLVGSTLKGIGDVAAGVASAFIPGAQSFMPRNYENDRPRYTSRDYNDRNTNSPAEFVGTAMRGFVNLAGSVASAFVPTGQAGSYRGSTGNTRDNNIAGTIINTAVQGVTDITRGLNTVATSVASNIPGLQNLVPRDPTDNKRSSSNSQPVGKDFMYTGSQVEDLTFTDANKKGEVSSDSFREKVFDTIKTLSDTASAAAQDAADMAYSAAQSFSSGASKGVISATTDFAIATGSAALSAATSAVRTFNAAASGADSGNDEAQKGFVYTGTQVKEDLEFVSTDNQNIEVNTKKSRHSTPVYDVVISGASVNGSALACALGHYRYFDREKQKILLLDPREPPSLQDFHTTKAVPDQKVVALSLSSVNFLKELGVWSLLNRNRIGSIRQMQIWELGGNSFVKINENPSKEIGNVVESTHLQAAFYERLRTMENIKLDVPNRITDFRNEQKGFATVVLDDEAKISAKLVVGSDGLNSVVKNKAKIASTGWSSQQYGIVCTVKTHYRHNTAWQRFLNTGPLAMLPLWDEYSAVIWSCESDLHQQLMEASDEDFVKELNYNINRKSQLNTPNIVLSPNAGFDIPPSITEICNKRKSFALSMQQANQYVGDRIALIGESAHNIHPLAGQGVNMGLTDAAYLANVIIKNLKAGNDIGNQDFLKEYETASANLNTAMLYSMEFFKRSYESNTYSPLVLARNLAVSAVNNFAPAKSILIDIANGKYFQPTDYEWKRLG